MNKKVRKNQTALSFFLSLHEGFPFFRGYEHNFLLFLISNTIVHNEVCSNCCCCLYSGNFSYFLEVIRNG